jgi:hypothetical protein
MRITRLWFFVFKGDSETLLQAVRSQNPVRHNIRHNIESLTVWRLQYVF